MLFRWFVGLGIHEQEWDATVFTKNRDRLLEGEVWQRLLEAVLEQARSKKLLSEEHFTVDGTILEAWASQKKRKLVERVFGWDKRDSVMRKIKLHGLRRVDWFFRFLATAHILVRMVKLVPAQ